MAYNTTPERFWSRVARSSPDACWLWQSTRIADGYGYISWNGKGARAHRLAWELTYGPIPDGLLVRHTCDTPLCCNPAHLLLGTIQDNMDDRTARGRTHRHTGESNGRAKLSTADVVYIREQHAAGTTSISTLARMYGVWSSTISEIVHGRHWK